MPKTITADDLDHAAAQLDIQLTTWQRDLLVEMFAARSRTGRWPHVCRARRSGWRTMTRLANAALA